MAPKRAKRADPASRTVKARRRRSAARRIVTAHAKAAADALAAGDGEAPIDPEAEDFGGDELEEAPPPPPAPPRSSEPPPTPPPPALVALGEPPADPLAAQAWLHRVMVASAADAATDTTISSRERRRELRTISASAAKLLPHARLYEAEQLIKADRRELESRQRAKRGAKLEPRTAAAAARVIPLFVPTTTHPRSEHDGDGPCAACAPEAAAAGGDPQ